MCSSESCLGYLLFFIVLFFALLIFVLLKLRKSFLKTDLSVSADTLWDEFSPNLSTLNLQKKDLLFSIWQDKSNSISSLLIKNHLDQVVARVEFSVGAREYNLSWAGSIYKIKVNLTWGGTNLSLITADGKELARLERKSFQPLRHNIFITGFEMLESDRQMNRLKGPITYASQSKPLAKTQFISPIRRIGRVGCFSDEIALPVQIFILAMTS